MVEPFTPEHVQAALDQTGLNLKIHFMDVSTATAPEAAAAAGTPLGSIAKSIVFMVDGKPLVVVTAGDKRVDDRKIATRYEVNRKKVKIATPEECIEIIGYAPGGVAPLGHRTPNLPVYIDETLSRFETVWAAAAAPNAIFPLTFEQLVQISGGIVADVVREDSE